MAKIGVSKPYYALYSNTGNTVSYSDGGVLGKATDVDVNINTSEDNNLYADNGIAEADRQFSDGTLTVGTDDLSQAVSKAILGAKEQAVGELTGLTGDTDVKELIFDDDLQNPYLGVGFIVKGQKNNVVYWRAIVFTKVLFNIPSDAATTQGQTIEWQTESLVATILRDDTEKHMWKRSATFSSEANAEAYIKNRLGITDTPANSPGVEQQAARSAAKAAMA